MLVSRRNVAIKLADQASSWQLLLVRCALQMVAMVPVMLCSKISPLGLPDWRHRAGLAAQAAIGIIALTLMDLDGHWAC